MASNEFVDYYELLELSPNASSEIVAEVFRCHAKKHEPDVTGSDFASFTKLVEAFETLRNLETRVAYDAQYEQQKQIGDNLVEGTYDSVHEERYKLLSLLYSQRRQDNNKPGIGAETVERSVDFPAQALSFHLWYFHQKGWIDREANGQLAITAKGVDQIESMQPPIPS